MAVTFGTPRVFTDGGSYPTSGTSTTAVDPGTADALLVLVYVNGALAGPAIEVKLGSVTVPRLGTYAGMSGTVQVHLLRGAVAGVLTYSQASPNYNPRRVVTAVGVSSLAATDPTFGGNSVGQNGQGNGQFPLDSSTAPAGSTVLDGVWHNYPTNSPAVQAGRTLVWSEATTGETKAVGASGSPGAATYKVDAFNAVTGTWVAFAAGGGTTPPVTDPGEVHTTTGTATAKGAATATSSKRATSARSAPVVASATRAVTTQRTASRTAPSTASATAARSSSRTAARTAPAVAGASATRSSTRSASTSATARTSTSSTSTSTRTLAATAPSTARASATTSRAYPPTATLVERFAAPLDPARWTTTDPAGAITYAQGELVMALVDDYASVQSVDGYALQGSSVSVHLSGAPGDKSGAEAGLALTFAWGDVIEVFAFGASEGGIGCRLNYGGQQGNAGTAYPKLPAYWRDGLWLRIRHVVDATQYGTLVWECAPSYSEDASAWSLLHSVESIWDTTAPVRVSLSGGDYSGQAPTVVTRFDNLNTGPDAAEVHVTSGTATGRALASSSSTKTASSARTAPARALTSTTSAKRATSARTALARASLVAFSTTLRAAVAGATARASASAVSAPQRPVVATATARASSTSSTASTRASARTGAATARTSSTSSPSRTSSGIGVAYASASCVDYTTRTTSGTAPARASATSSALGDEVHVTADTATAKASASASTTSSRAVSGSARASAGASCTSTSTRRASRTARATASASAVVLASEVHSTAATATARASTSSSSSTTRSPELLAGASASATSSCASLRTGTAQALSRARASSSATALRTAQGLALAFARASAGESTTRLAQGLARAVAGASAVVEADHRARVDLEVVALLLPGPQAVLQGSLVTASTDLPWQGRLQRTPLVAGVLPTPVRAEVG